MNYKCIRIWRKTFSSKSKMKQLISILAIVVGFTSAQKLVCTNHHENLSNCGSPCGDGCNNIRMPRPCVASCIVKEVCICESGYARSPITGHCVPTSSCPTTTEYDYANGVIIGQKASDCKANETYIRSNRCNEGCDLAATSCQAVDSTSPEACFCKSDYCRPNKYGRCILRSNYVSQ